MKLPDTNVQINLSTKDYNKTNRAFMAKGFLFGVGSGWVLSLLTILIGYNI